jgi:hypothetical protein|tara:strand:- start:72 stop:194 length:123 start_codon:yes stop_codon:yes gene_type:complete
MVLPVLVIPAILFALWAIPKGVDGYEGIKKHSNRKGKGKK